MVIILGGGNLFKSLQGKIVLIYSLLILFSLQLFSVYLVQSLEQYYLNNYKVGLEAQARLLTAFLAPLFSEGIGTNEDIAHLVREFGGLQDTEVIVLDNRAQILGTSDDQSAIGRPMIRTEITRALTGEADDAIRFEPVSNERRYYLAYPVAEGGHSGVIYLSGSLNKMDTVLNEIRIILLTGAGVALAISFFIGIFLTRTITAPVTAITNQAELMARGDFGKKIKIEASDEIGRLGATFNYLGERLSHNIKKISSEKSKVEAMINNMSDGVIALDGKGRLLQINPAARSLLQTLNIRSLAGEQSCFSWLKKLLGKEGLTEYLQRKEPVTIEIDRPKIPFILQVKLAPFNLEQGKHDGTLIVMHDVTGERELVRRQQEFVADVSHELRTPLATVKSYIETLLDGAAEDPEVRLRFLRVLESETGRMVSMVKDLLSLSQLDYSQVELHKTEVDIKALVMEAVDQCKEKNAAEMPGIEIVIPPELPSFFVDRDKITQVLLNLLDNATRHTPSRGKITVSAEDRGSELQITVADTGSGIPAEDLERVFDRFYRVEKTRSRYYGGTGLGLSIAQKLIAAHGGKIWLESASGEGTRAAFSLFKDDPSKGELS